MEYDEYKAKLDNMNASQEIRDEAYNEKVENGTASSAEKFFHGVTKFLQSVVNNSAKTIEKYSNK
jgi:hypothetical protein